MIEVNIPKKGAAIVGLSRRPSKGFFEKINQNDL